MNSWEKDDLLKKISKGKITAKKLNEEAKNDFVIMTQICQNNAEEFEFASEELKSNREFIIYLIDNCINSTLSSSNKKELFDLFPNWVKSERDLCLSAIKKRARVLNFVENKLKNDLDFQKEAININPQVIHYCSEELKNDIEISKMVVSRGYCTYRSIKEEHKLNLDIFFKAIEISGFDDFEYTPKELFDSRENIIKMIQIGGSQGSLLFPYLKEEFQNDIEIISLIIEKTGFVLKYLNNEFKNNKPLVIKCLKHDGSLIEYASEELKSDEEFLYSLIESKVLNSDSFQFLSKKLLSNKKFILKVLKLDYKIFNNSSEELRSDEEVVIEAIYNAGLVPDRIRNLKNYILQSESKIVNSLKHLLDSKDGVYPTELITSQKTMLCYLFCCFNEKSYETMPKAYQLDKELAMLAINHLGYFDRGNFIKHLNDTLKNDSDILEIIKSKLS